MTMILLFQGLKEPLLSCMYSKTSRGWTLWKSVALTEPPPLRNWSHWWTSLRGPVAILRTRRSSTRDRGERCGPNW